MKQATNLNFDTRHISIQEILDAVGAEQFTQYGMYEARHYANCTRCQGYTPLFIAKALEVIARRNNKPVFIYRTR